MSCQARKHQKRANFTETGGAPSHNWDTSVRTFGRLGTPSHRTTAPTGSLVLGRVVAARSRDLLAIFDT